MEWEEVGERERVSGVCIPSFFSPCGITTRAGCAPEREEGAIAPLWWPPPPSFLSSDSSHIPSPRPVQDLGDTAHPVLPDIWGTALCLPIPRQQSFCQAFLRFPRSTIWSCPDSDRHTGAETLAFHRGGQARPKAVQYVV